MCLNRLYTHYTCSVRLHFKLAKLTVSDKDTPAAEIGDFGLIADKKVSPLICETNIIKQDRDLTPLRLAKKTRPRLVALQTC